jgi:PEGA domain
MPRKCRSVFVAVFVFVIAGSLQATKAANDNEVLGEIHFQADNGPAKSAGVWVDGKYIGYLGELKGSKKLLLLPGEHAISVREAGFKTVDRTVTVEPGEAQTFHVLMAKDPQAQYPAATGEVKLSIEPDRAAVFVDNQYAGHAHEFSGGNGMLLGPGKHEIKVTLPGYQSFSTEIDVRTNQKYEIKTQLAKGNDRENANAASSNQ